MRWRRAKPEDIPEIQRLWKEAAYGFPFPDLESDAFISSWVAIEQGKIIYWAGARLEPEILAICAPSCGSPHQRLKLFAQSHAPIAKDLRARGFERVFATLDPKFPKFGKRLGVFGWQKGWDYWFLLVEKVLGVKK
jgi:hypothetical protein